MTFINHISLICTKKLKANTTFIAVRNKSVDITLQISPLYLLVSHAGHTSMLGVEDKHDNFQDIATYSLQEQISHKVDYLAMLEEKENAKLNFVLIGHSVGSYICLKVIFHSFQIINHEITKY